MRAKRYLSTVAVLASTWLVSPAAAQGLGWSIQPAPGRGALLGVSCASQARCTAVGDVPKSLTSPLADLLIERWNGHHWSIQHPPTPSGTSGSSLSSISCTSSSACIAVGSATIGPSGDKTVPLAERWNGSRWRIQRTPTAPAGLRDGSLVAVSCTSANACTAVARYVTGPGNGAPVAERWNGTTWSIQRVPVPAHSGGTMYLTGVSCSARTSCLAVGNALLPGPQGPTDSVVAERWNGVHWSQHLLPIPAEASGASLEAVSCIAPRSCEAAGDALKPQTSPFSPPTQEPLAERLNGTRWSIQRTPKPAIPNGSWFNGISCTSSAACIAVGYGPLGLKTIAAGWDGQHWSLQHTPALSGSSNAVLAVACSAAALCTAVGTSNNAPLIERYS
jgi:hypothetical protein